MVESNMANNERQFIEYAICYFIINKRNARNLTNFCTVMTFTIYLYYLNNFTYSSMINNFMHSRMIINKNNTFLLFNTIPIFIQYMFLILRLHCDIFFTDTNDQHECC